MKVTCLQCSTSIELPEGGDVTKTACPACKAPAAQFFIYSKTVAFQPQGDETDGILRMIRTTLEAGRLEEVERSVRTLLRFLGHPDRAKEIARDPRLRTVATVDDFERLINP